MRILIIGNSSAGVYLFRKELLEELICKGHQVYVSVSNDYHADDIRHMGCKVIENRFLEAHGTNPVKEFMLLRYYGWLLGKALPDIVFTYTIKPNIYAGIVCANKGIPYVTNITGLGTAVEKHGIFSEFVTVLYRFGIRKAQKVFIQNKANRNFLLSKKVITGGYDMLPGSGVNLGRFPLLDYPDSETVHFIFVSRIVKEKGIDQYLKAAEIIRKKYPATRFHVCGPCGGGYKSVIEESQRKGDIIYEGMVENMMPIYEMAACTVHPTYYPEGMSNVLLESCACGRPIITTNRPGCGEIVEDGVNGYVVKERDSGDLIKKIEKFLMLSVDIRRRLGEEGRKKVERYFDRKIVIRKYMGEMEKVL